MKKLISVLLCCAMLCSMAGCSTLAQKITTDDNVGALVDEDEPSIGMPNPVTELTKEEFIEKSGITDIGNIEGITCYSVIEGDDPIYQVDATIDETDYNFRFAKGVGEGYKEDITGVYLSGDVTTTATVFKYGVYSYMQYDAENAKMIGTFGNGSYRFGVSVNPKDMYNFSTTIFKEYVRNLMRTLQSTSITEEEFLENSGMSSVDIDGTVGYSHPLGQGDISQVDVELSGFAYSVSVAKLTSDNADADITGVTLENYEEISDYQLYPWLDAVYFGTDCTGTEKIKMLLTIGDYRVGITGGHKELSVWSDRMEYTDLVECAEGIIEDLIASVGSATTELTDAEFAELAGFKCLNVEELVQEVDVEYGITTYNVNYGGATYSVMNGFEQAYKMNVKLEDYDFIFYFDKEADDDQYIPIKDLNTEEIAYYYERTEGNLKYEIYSLKSQCGLFIGNYNGYRFVMYVNCYMFGTDLMDVSGGTAAWLDAEDVFNAIVGTLLSDENIVE